MTEAEELHELLEKELTTYCSGWTELSWVGAKLEGWETVDRVEKGEGRWSKTIQVITQAPSGNHYAWRFDEGLTENQEDDYYGGVQDIVPVYAAEETIIVKVWKDADK